MSAGSPIISAMTTAGMGAAKALISSVRAHRLKLVDHLVGEPVDARSQLLDMARDEGAVDEHAEPRVGGRLERQQGVLFGQIERGGVVLGRRPAKFVAAHHMEDLASEALVAQQRVDLLEAGKAPVAVVLPVKARPGAVPIGVVRIGVSEKGAVAGIGGNTPVGHLGGHTMLEFRSRE